MTLRMADGPAANLPPGMDAYAGYVDQGGDGITWPTVEKLAAPDHLSISVHGHPAMCADVENGAMSSWAGYAVGYCSVANYSHYAGASNGHPVKYWSAHYNGLPKLGPAPVAHICGPHTCGALGFTADGTQWIDHGGWDESLLRTDFFDFLDQPKGPDVGVAFDPKTGGSWGVKSDGSVYAYTGAPYLGGLNTHPEWNIGAVGTVAGIVPWPGDGTDTGGNGYAVYVETPTGFTLYRFPGDGSLRS